MQGVIGELAYILIGECGLVQEIKDYSDLKRQFNDFMDNNDICTPTSKEDPSYYTLLEFLQQFLPKGLYQTIDDKKVMIFPHQTLNL
jgi:hypothetical protein